MDIRQVQNEIKAVKLMAKSREIVDFINTATGGDIDSTMTGMERAQFIQTFSFCHYGGKWKGVFLNDFLEGKVNLPENAQLLNQNGMGRELLKTYSANEIFLANTLSLISTADGVYSEFEIVYSGSLPVVLKPRKTFNRFAEFQSVRRNLPFDSTMIEKDNVQVIRLDVDADNHRILYDTDTNPFTSAQDEKAGAGVNVRAIKELISDKSPDFELVFDQEACEAIVALESWQMNHAKDPNIIAGANQVLLQSEGNVSSGELSLPFTQGNPLNLKTKEGIITIPLVPFRSFVNLIGRDRRAMDDKDIFPVRIGMYKQENGWLFDASSLNETRIKITADQSPTGEEFFVTKRLLNRLLCLQTFDYDLYPSVYFDFDPANPQAQPPTLEEIAESSVDVLVLPNNILINQMRVEYNNRRIPISAASLDKWSKSDLSYESAKQIMNEHLAYYTRVEDIDDKKVRLNNGDIYAQTKEGVASRLTNKGKLNQAAFTNIMSKYVFTIEETFFNLNPDFSDPEKLLGYFLGMGIVNNALFLDGLNPYRILCARLLGIDYFQGYSDLCKHSCIAGHLFISNFEDGKPVYVSADTFLQGNVYGVHMSILQDDYKKALDEFFKDASEEVYENHEQLIRDNSPIFMKFHHGSLNEYEALVSKHGVGLAYKKGVNQQQETTRITLAQGVIPENRTPRLIKPWEEDVDVVEQPPSPDMRSFLGGLFESNEDVLKQDISRLVDKLFEANGSKANSYVGSFSYGKMKEEFPRLANKALSSLATEKLSYNDLTKAVALDIFFDEPMVDKIGPYEILTRGISMTNTDLGPVDGDRMVETIKFIYDLSKVKTLNKKSYTTLINQGLREDSRSQLVKLGLIEEGAQKVNDELAKLIAERAIGMYHEIKSQARIEGDELLTYAIANFDKEGDNGERIKSSIEYMWNMKFNNYAERPMGRVPIFLENMRFFGKLEDFAADQYTEDGKLAGFSLREAQKTGLKYLGAGGNSGLLAHEVGFGKTTSSIAKVSDMFLRGDAKRVLISVPNAVYGGRNWEIEIKGDYFGDGSKKRNGLLPSNINLVKLGTLDLKSLRGEKINESHPDWAEKSEGTEYNGAVKYTDSELKLIESLKGSIESLLDVVGGANIKYGTKSQLLTPREQTYATADKKYHIKPLPFFNTESEVAFNDILRLDSLGDRGLDFSQKAKINPAYKLVNEAKDFWQKRKGDEIKYFGSIEDLSDSAKNADNSFIVALKEVLLEKSPDLEVGEDGGELKLLFDRFLSTKRDFDELANKPMWQTSVGRSRPDRRHQYLGGFMMPRAQDATIDGQSVVENLVDVLDSDGNATGGAQLVPYITNQKERGEKSKGNFLSPESLALLIANGIEGEGAGFWPFSGTRSFYERVLRPWAKAKKIGDIVVLAREIQAVLPLEWASNNGFLEKKGSIMGVEFEPLELPEFYQDLAFGQLRTAIEALLTEEVAFAIQTLQTQAPLFLGRFKEWAMRPNTILLTSHLAINKLKVDNEFVEQSIKFMAGLDAREGSGQTLHLREDNKGVKGEKVVRPYNVSDKIFEFGVLTRKQQEKMYLSKYRGMELSRLNADAFVVDEVHNFNRAFKQVMTGLRVEPVYKTRSTRKDKSSYREEKKSFRDIKDTQIDDLNMIRAKGKGNVLFDTIAYTYDTKANYSVRPEVQNFIAICLYFQRRGEKISENQKRKIENTIFLSATPFTDDNFQMLSLFGAMSAKKLAQGNVFNTFDFFQTYANELWQKDIDYQNQYTLFPKIVGYKNVYALSNLIRTFTNFKISDAEINSNRPQKVIIGVETPTLDENNKALEDVLSQVPFNEVQEKMNKDLESYITLDRDTELNYKQSDIAKARKIYNKLKSSDEGSLAEEEVQELLKVEGFELIKKKKNQYEVSWPLGAVQFVEPLMEAIIEKDPENAIGLAVQAKFNEDLEIDIEGGEDKPVAKEEADEEGTDKIGGNALKDASKSKAQQIAQRALEASRTQQLVLISPYYLTIANDKKSMNPYLPTLDGTPSQNAKNVIENSPKLLYACQAIAKVLDYKLNKAPDAEKQFYGSDTNKLLGQVVYCDNYQFGYHGKMFNIFDLMTQYIIDENQDLLKQIEPDESRHRDLFAAIDGRTKTIEVDGEKIDEKGMIVDKFNSGEVLVLFGTSAIREGINLQKNCPIMYILQVGFVPVTFMQLHGRIWRQGNPYKNAFLVNVVTQNSIDAFVYSKLTQKIQSVREMLEGDVYDANTTQFDVDVNEIKMKLINDPQKLAEMWWDDEQVNLSREANKMDSDIAKLGRLQSEYPQAQKAYADARESFNMMSSALYQLDLAILAKIKLERVNKENEREAAEAQVAIDYPKQFKDEKQQKQFEEDKEKFVDKKTGEIKFKTRTQMYNQVIKSDSFTFKKVTLEEAKELVISENEAGKLNAQRKLMIQKPFAFVEATSISDFIKETGAFEDAVGKAELSADKMERDLSYRDMQDMNDLFKELMERIKTMSESGQTDEEEFLSLFNLKIPFVYSNRFKFRAFVASLVLKVYNKDGSYGGNSRLVFSTDVIKRELRKFKTGDTAITIGAFHDLLSNFTLKNGKKATIDDVDEVIQTKEETKAEAERKLNDPFGEIDKAKERYKVDLAKLQAGGKPSVEKRVKALEALFPYMIYR